MKKVTLFVAAFAIAAAFSSCKKAYHCECTVGGITAKSATVEYNKKDAEAAEKSCTANGVCKWVKE